MLIHLPPTTNTERQRQFRKRNPGYYGRLHSKRKAVAQLMDAATAPALPIGEPLMLPAPVETFAFADRATIPTVAELQAERELLVALPIAR